MLYYKKTKKDANYNELLGITYSATGLEKRFYRHAGFIVEALQEHVRKFRKERAKKLYKRVKGFYGVIMDKLASRHNFMTTENELKKNIAILLATYNGERYLDEQLLSLFSQTLDNFVVYANDDCSNDGTLRILERFSKEYPNRIIISRNEYNSGSAKFNFMKLITTVSADYVFLCDQDDVWTKDKLKTSLAELHKLENKYGKKMPLLIHTDLAVVDKELNVIAPSYRMQVLHPKWDQFDFKQSLSMNIATGSTILYNRALADYFTVIPDFLVMHDWWILQTALAFGKVGNISDQTVLYRQHDKNELGSSNIRSIRYKFDRLVHNDKIKKRYEDSYKQASQFLKIYGGRLDEQQKRLLREYCGLGDLCKLERVYKIFRLGVAPKSISRMIATILFA